jgi:AbrB family looped-hinge helix DNA binding protein
MRITSKGQVTIPQPIRERLGLLPHTEVQFIEEEGRLYLCPGSTLQSRGEEAISRLRRGGTRKRMSADELLALTRGEAD